MRRDKVLQHVQPFAEVGGNWLLDDLARRLSHQTAHTGKLADLLFRSAGAGVGHDVNRVEIASGTIILLHALKHFVGDTFGHFRPDFDDLVVALALRDGAFLILLLDFDDRLFGVLHQLGLFVRHHHVVDADGNPGARSVQEPELLHLVQHLDGDDQTELQVAVLHQLRETLLLQQAVDEGHLFRQHVVQDHAAHRGIHILLVELDRLGVNDVLVVERLIQVDHFAGIAQLNGRQRFHFTHFERDQDVVGGGEGAAFTFGAGTGFGQIVETQHHVLGRDRDRRAVRGRQYVVRRQHQRGSFDLRFRRQRNVDGHLVTIEVGVERRAGERMQLDRLAFHQDRLEGLDTEAVQRGSAVEKDRMILDDFFENVPNHRVLLLDQFFGLLDGGAMAALLEPMIDEGLEQLQRHFLGQTALMQLQLRTDHDHGTAGIVDALTEQVLTETALLAFESIGKRFERAVVGATQNAAAAAVVEQSVDGLLQHALFVANDDIGSVQFNELLQPVVSVDHAAIQVVEIGRGEAAAIQRHQRTKLGRNHRDDIQDHPLRLVAGLAETFHHAQALGEFELLLLRYFGLHLLADFEAETFDVDALQKLFNTFGAHHGDEFSGELLVELALALVGNHFTALQLGNFARVHYHESFEIKNALQFTERDVKQVSDTAGQPFEEPDMRAGAGELDMAETLAAHPRQRHFHAALVANHAAVLHALVFAA